MSGSNCAACGRTIDSAAKLCPYCGANPQTGERIDTQAILQEVFRPREITTSESVLEYARQRQGIVIAITAFVAFLILAAFHQFVTMRNSTAVTDSPAVPLSEVTELTKKSDETTPVPMPKLDFQYDGRPRAMRTYIVERGAVKPAPAMPLAPPATQQPQQPATPPSR
ncbi:MAG TPA: zinc ribbon domain-containing protein [Thermoanaerobaculia bacterium]|nr:zinc ribbon domain-containing protein [Thermoanaerobaculia bacterium]